MPKLSVIIPIYGVEKTIERCARSLFEQTIDDIEYIFINDCTKDKSIDILKKVSLDYPHRKKQIQIIDLHENKGLPTVRKTGIQLAKGDYIVHCDSDDWVDKHAYKKLVDKAYEHDTDIIFYDYFKTDGKNHIHIKTKLNLKSDIISNVIKNKKWNLCGAMIKRSIYLSNEITYPIANNYEDLALMIQLLFYAKSFQYIKEPFYYYYTNPNSITVQKGIQNTIKKVNDACCNLNLIILFCEQKNISSKYKNEILMLKLDVKSILSHIINKGQIYFLWKSIYPETDTPLLYLNQYITFIRKIKYLATKTKTFPLLFDVYKIITNSKHSI